jgi:hypothetical protein
MGGVMKLWMTLFFMFSAGAVLAADLNREQQAERQSKRAHAYATREDSNQSPTNAESRDSNQNLPVSGGLTAEGGTLEKNIEESVKALEKSFGRMQ